MIPIPGPAIGAWHQLTKALVDAGPVPCQTRGQPEDWWRDAGRRDPGPDRAVARCRRCPVRSPCLRYASAADEQHGIWGAVTPDERCQLATGNRESA
jgi:hypothetical protein